MKVLFLDVDGVLCTRRSFLSYDKEGTIWRSWDQLAVDVINRVGERGVKVVLSSTWRKPANIHDFHVQCRKYYLRYEWFFDGEWKTPILHERPRGEEIQAWLDNHPEITDYKILDDDCILLDHQEKHLIQTDMDEGMTSDNIKKLYNWAGVLKS